MIAGLQMNLMRYVFARTQFEDSAAERQFTAEYHEVALDWGVLAAVAIALVFLLFAIVSAATELYSWNAQLLRIVLALVLLFVAYRLHYHRQFCRRHYESIASACSVLTLGGAILLPQLPGGDPSVASTVTPAVMFGLFMHYSALRLSLVRSATIGWSASVVGAFWAPMVVGGSEILRTFIYLSFANVIGMLISRLRELRERELFLQRREAESARCEARERAAAAEEANQQKTRLIAAVSHDLRQPMTAAVAHLDLLQSRLDRDDRAGAITQAGRAATAVGVLGETLDHLLTAARYDSGTESIRIETVDLAPMLRRLRDDYQPDARSRQLELRLRLPRRRVLVRTDVHSLQRVLGNLVSNGLKFTDRADRPGRGVIVRARYRDNRCRIDVVDTGLGIAPEHRDLVWEPYVQINNAERDRQRGLGLGLFLVRRIVEQLPAHRVTMHSRLGRGSRFSVELPAMTLAAPPVPPLRGQPDDRQAVLDRSALRGAYILFLEDDHETRLSLQELFDEWGLLYASGGTMRELLSSHEDSDRLVDAIVCDYRLPGGMTGAQCIEQLRERLGYAARAIVITGESDLDAVRARLGPDTVVLHKPFATSALAAPLVEAIESARVAEQSRP
jgi:signal transduction histidine kinase